MSVVLLAAFPRSFHRGLQKRLKRMRANESPVSGAFRDGPRWTRTTYLRGNSPPNAVQPRSLPAELRDRFSGCHVASPGISVQVGLHLDAAARAVTESPPLEVSQDFSQLDGLQAHEWGARRVSTPPPFVPHPLSERGTGSAFFRPRLS